MQNQNDQAVDAVPDSELPSFREDQERCEGLAGKTLGEIERAVCTLMVDEPENELALWLNLSAVVVERAKQIRARVEQYAIEWIETAGPLQVGDIRYSVGQAKTVRCTNSERCLSHVLEACGGDLEAVVSYLRTDPFKYGSLRSLLDPSLFEQLFRTETKPKLQEGQLKPQLIQTNTQFVARALARRATNTHQSES